MQYCCAACAYLIVLVQSHILHSTAARARPAGMGQVDHWPFCSSCSARQVPDLIWMAHKRPSAYASLSCFLAGNHLWPLSPADKTPWLAEVVQALQTVNQ